MANRPACLGFTFWTALFALSACTDGPSGGGSGGVRRTGDGAGQYGEERIGYKTSAAAGDQTLERESGGAGDVYNAAPAPAQTAAGGTNGGTTGTTGFSDPWSGGPSTGGVENLDGISGSAPPADTDGDAEFSVDAGLDACPAGHVGTDAGVPEGCGEAGVDGGTDEEGGVAKQFPDASAQQQTAPDAPLENPFFLAKDEPASTFALDVDGASYALARAALQNGFRPDPKSIRTEEFINYFHLHYAQPEGEQPLSVYSELSPCPWQPDHQLMLLGVQGQEVDVADAPPANLVFLLDVSGSMSAADKLPLVKKGIRLLTRLLRAQDRVSIVTYAGSDRVVLEGVPGNERETLLAAIDALESGGSTNGSGGIQRAYELAHEHFIQGGNNRVLLATDGDFNVGLTDTEALTELISSKRDQGVYLSLFGFGDAYGGGNYRDETGEQLTNHGDGIYFYVDSEEEARRAFLHSASGSLITVAKDVKIQVEFNPERVAAYRLVGYENRVLANEDFSNDNVDGGELGASLSMTALYEIIPAGTAADIPEPLPGTVPDTSSQAAPTEASAREDLGPVGGEDFYEVRIRYEGSHGGESQLLRYAYDKAVQGETASLKHTFAASVAELAAHLRGSQYIPYRGADVLKKQLKPVLSIDEEGAVQEVIQLLDDVAALP